MCVVVALANFSSCGNSGDGVSGSNSTPLMISASQIVFRQDSGIQTIGSTNGVVDPSVKVLAENVYVDNASNGLTSDNLQDALDNELAVSLAKTLIGKTWNITNKSMDIFYADTTGIATFNNDGTMTLISGRFAAIGEIHVSENSICDYPQSIKYEIISDEVVYVISNNKSRTDDTTYTRDAVVKIVSRSSDRIVMTGAGGCGGLGSERISILTPQDTVPSSNIKSATKTKRAI
jgi:hypothetical protein